MKKTISRTIPTTTAKFAKVEKVDGQIIAVENEQTLLGNLTIEEAQKELSKQHGSVTVLSVETHAKLYEASVLDFIDLAEVHGTVTESDEDLEV
ncbi:dsDNA binding protein [Bacillus phage GA1]|uniref:DBP n=1 Tax=Bacillus phage GA-1 TaxID=2679898 RepID=Q9XJP5_BPGA1|nr:dsDNA binding protein [Bacillus phage GA1]CAC21527.1 DBP [Bacillus phage GA1]